MSWEVVPYNPSTWERFPVVGSMEVNGPSLDLNFLGGTLDSRITFARASTATSGLYTDAAGSSYTSFATGVARIDTVNGLLIEDQRTNSLLNSDTPATQTTASLATGTYTLWVIGSGTATSSAGTATGTGFGAATAGTPNTFTLTGAGTVTVTKSGTLTRFQLELGTFPTSYIPTTGSTATRASDLVTLPPAPWFNSIAGTMAAVFVSGRSAVGAGLSPVVFEVDDGATNNLIALRLTNTAGIQGSVFVSGSQIANATVSGPWTALVASKAALSYTASSVSSALNGGTITTVSNTGLPATISRAIFGAGRSNSLNGWISRLRYWPRVLSSNDLIGVTT